MSEGVPTTSSSNTVSFFFFHCQMSWAISYKASCDAEGVARRPELLDDPSLQRVLLPGNDPKRFENRVDDRETATLCRAIAASSAITEVDLCYSRIGDEGAHSIAELLGRNSTLQHLNLSHNSIQSAGGKAIADSLLLNISLITLSLRGNSLGEDGGLAMSAMLRGNNTLVVLDLGQCDLGVHSLVSLSLALVSQPTVCCVRLDKPLLRGPQELSSVVQHLATMLQRNQAIVELSLNFFGLGDDHLTLLLPFLVQSPSLRQLSLIGNKLTAEGGVGLSAMLSRRPDFTSLRVAGNRIDNDGAAALAAAIRTHPTLSEVDLQTNAIGTKGLVALAEAVQLSPALKRISLWGNRFESEAAFAFHQRRKDVLAAAASSATISTSTGPGLKLPTTVTKKPITAVLDFDTYMSDCECLVSRV